MTNFLDDIKRGKVGEQIFLDDFLNFMEIEYKDVTNCQQFQIIDCDFVSKIGLYEIKSNYKDNKIIIIEEYTNINEKLSKISNGWFYKTQANLIIFISKKTRVMIFLPMTENFKNHYESIKENYKLILNKISVHNDRRWQSAFRCIPLESIKGFYSMYKKIK